LSAVVCTFTFVFADGLSFVGEPGFGVAGTFVFTLRGVAEPVLRTAGVLGFDVAAGPVGVELPARLAAD